MSLVLFVYRHIASFLSIFKLFLIGLVIVGKDPFMLFGMESPRLWTWSQENKVRLERLFVETLQSEVCVCVCQQLMSLGQQLSSEGVKSQRSLVHTLRINEALNLVSSTLKCYSVIVTPSYSKTPSCLICPQFKSLSPCSCIFFILQIYACMMVFFFSNMLENQCLSTGAFEITLNGKTHLTFAAVFRCLILNPDWSIGWFVLPCSF